MTAENGIRSELARAKVNLTLHVGRAIQTGPLQGYHPVDSLVVFADFGDRLCFSPDEQASFEISGPFSEGLDANSDNLVSQALNLCKSPAQKVRLEKNIPISAGLGGGSANAAAVLRVFDPDHHIKGANIGADVPVCRRSQTSLMQGIGEKITPLVNLGQIPAVLINPLKPISTGAVFTEFDSVQRDVLPSPNSTKGSLLERALAGRNDLQSVSVKIAPVISTVLSKISEQKECQLSRMSGSGASCFGLFETEAAAKAAAESIGSSHPDWWVRACRLGEPS